MDASDVVLPGFLDPVLDYLSSTLPPSVYDVLITLLTHTISLLGSLVSLGKALISSHPSSWDAQAILPPLITLLAAYLALVSFWRTTGWMIRTGIWFVKWGTILSALAAGAGYMMGNANGENGVGGPFAGGGISPAVGGLILDMINGQGQNAAGGARSARSSRTSRARSQRQQAPRPKAWESWDRHQEWQYNENAQHEEDAAGDDVQKVLGNILGAVGRTVAEGGWWEAARGAAEKFGVGKQEDGHDEGSSRSDSGRRKQPPRKAKTNAKGKTDTR